MGYKNIAACLLIVMGSAFLSGMAKRVDFDLSHDPKYSPLVGKEYKTKVELLIYRYQGSKNLLLHEYGGGIVPKKEEMKDIIKFPFSYYSTIIEGVVPVGTVFQIGRVSVEGPSGLTSIHCYADILSSSAERFKNKKVSVSFLTDLGDPPQFKPDLVEEITSADIK